MAFPVIAYRTILRNAGATLTPDPGTETGFDQDDIKDYKSYTLWKSNATTSPINRDIDLGVGNTATADYIMLVNTNLNTVGATITVHSDDNAGFATPTVLLAATAVGTDNVWYKSFTVGPAERFWRAIITDPAPPFAAKPFIGELFLGLRTTLPVFLWADFDPFFDDIEAVGSGSEGGHHLGTLLRGHIHRDTISFGDAGAPRSFYTSDLNAMIQHAQKKLPFGFILDTGDSDFAVARYLKVPTDDRVARGAVGGTYATNLILDMPVEAAFMEPA